MSRLALVTILTGAVALGGCGSTQSPAAALSSWVGASAFPSAVSTLLADSSTVHGAIGSHDSVAALHTVCAELLDDAQGTNDELPTPDGQLTALLASAYDGLVQAASRCYDGAGSRAALARADAQRSAAIATLVTAVLRAEAVLGRSIKVAGIA